MEKFRSLLPVDRNLTEEVEMLIKFTYSSKLLTVETTTDAVILFEIAVNHPRLTTVRALEDQHDLVIDGDFEFNIASAKTTLVRAFSKRSGAPYLLKFGPDITDEFNNFRKLGLSEEQSLEHFILPMTLVECTNHRPSICFPVMYCSLDVVPRLDPSLVLEKLTNSILPALTYLHMRDLYHMDVKAGNILIGPNYDWFLCDLGSMVEGERRPVRKGLTWACIPRDLPCISGRSFDYTLLVVCAISKVDPQRLARFDRFTLEDIVRMVRAIPHENLRNFCLNLLPEL